MSSTLTFSHTTNNLREQGSNRNLGSCRYAPQEGGISLLDPVDQGTFYASVRSDWESRQAQVPRHGRGSVPTQLENNRKSGTMNGTEAPHPSFSTWCQG